MKSEFEAPTYANVGQPEPPRIPTAVSLEKAAELLRTNGEGVVRLISEGKLRLLQTDRPVSGVTLICSEELYQILLARQRNAG